MNATKIFPIAEDFKGGVSQVLRLSKDWTSQFINNSRENK